MKNEKAFTLIEITMAVLILAAITLIAIPAVKTLLDNSHERAYRIAVNTIEDAAKSYQYMHSTALETNLQKYGSIGVTITQLKEEGFITEDIQNPRNDTSMSGYVLITKEGKKLIYEYLEGTPPTPGYIVNEGVNRPILATGMIAIKWNGSDWDDVTNPNTDTSWYDYANKQWANARTGDGSLWVWIPRFAYQISSNYHTSTTGTIDVKFMQGITDVASDNTTISSATPTYSGSSQTNYIVHPAFNFNSVDLTGIWVAKFEASSPSTSSCYTSASEANCNVINLIPKSVPNVPSWRYISVGNAFTVTRNMEVNSAYGWGTSGVGIDTHLMKNTEWGMVTYLSKSQYGKSTVEVWINPNQNYTTGCAGNNYYDAYSSICNTYETVNGVRASTTGNIYGIYDMSGGAGEYQAAYVNNGTENLNTYGGSIINASGSYKDIYTVGTTDSMANNYIPTVDKKGDAIWEVSGSVQDNYGWFNDSTYFPFFIYPWVYRGNNPYYGGTTSGIFCLYDYTGGASSNIGFRPVILIDSSL